MNSYIETEIKILDIDPVQVKEKLESLGAKKVFDDNRTITLFDYEDKRLQKQHCEVRLTEEGKLKLSFEEKNDGEQKQAIKIFVSRKEETVDFLAKLGLTPVTQVTSHRTSYEWNNIDFDIDEYIQIPAFLEIDRAETNIFIEEILKLLELKGKEPRIMSTVEIFQEKGLDYYNIFKV